MARSRTGIVAAAALLLVALELLLASRAGALFGDYRAFYCAGAALLHGHNPYAAAPLYACERTAQPFGLYSALPGVAVPAPLPGYALLLFVPLALLPYTVSCAVWLTVLLASCIASCVALARLTGSSAAGTIAVFATGFAVAILPYGELASLCIAALLLMALALRRGAWTPAAIAGAAAAILPHVALPALAAAFIGKPRLRVPLLIAGAVLALLDVAAGGAGTAVQYFTQVLPAHALSEVGRTSQYGLTWALHALGAADKAAIAGGQISYVFMSVAGIVIAILLAKRDGESAWLALIPTAFAVFGGSFMHYGEIMAALPASVLLFTRTRRSVRAALLVATLLLAFPWSAALGTPLLIVVFAIAAGGIAWAFAACDVSIVLRVALGCVLLTAAIVAAGAHFGPALANHAAAGGVDASLAQASWSEQIRMHGESAGIIWWIAKAPTWIGLALLTLCGAYVVAKKDFVVPVVVEQVPVRP